MKFRSFFMLAMMALLLVGIMPLNAQETDAFPVTIEHQYGSTTITGAPKRVVAIGFTEQDFLLAVDVTPVAVRYWYGDETDAIFPWADDRVQGDAPIILNMAYGNLNYEAILDLKPDLISAVTAGITQDEYDLLSQIAPTITQTDEYINFGMPWQEVMQMVGAAVGKSAEAEAIVTDVEGLFADAIDQNPEFAGKSVAVSYYSEGTYGFYTAEDSRGRFFTDLGFVVPEEFVEIAGASFYANISTEEIGLIDQDLIAILNLQFIEGGRETLEADPLFSQLNAVKDGRVLYLEEQAENALGFSSPLSLVYALDTVLPQLQAIFGEPTAAASTCEAGFRLFDHEYLAGEPICIPENPQRILALELSALESVLLADKNLVGTADWLLGEVPVLLPELAPALEGIVDTGYPANLEAALESAPDLILAVDGDIDLEAGNKIAPVVMPLPGIEHDWRLSMEFWSAVLGTEELYADMVANYDARIAEFKAVLTESPTISIIGASSYGASMWLEDTAPGVVVTEAGLSRPESQALSGEAANEVYGEERWITLSAERLDLADADAIFVFSYATTDPATLETETAAMETFKSDPLWNALSAVREDHVYYVGPHWWRAQTYLLANRVLDDLFANLTDTSATTPVLDLSPEVTATAEP